MLHNALPVAANLKKRGIKVDQNCQVCGEEVETLQHMLINCRVAKEIWSFVLGDIPEYPQADTAVLQFFQYLIEKANINLCRNRAFFTGWRIWKMRNKIIFDNKRDHIVQVVHSAIMDEKVWKEVIMHNVTEQHTTQQTSQNSTNNILQLQTNYYCVVDASWKSPTDKVGIGWSLFSKEGTHILHGSSAINPTSSPYSAEAMAILSAAQQLYSLNFNNVTFLTDCMELSKSLAMELDKVGRGPRLINQAYPIIQDIIYIAKQNVFTFKYVSRNYTSVADQLAKKARITNQQYVISWLI